MAPDFTRADLLHRACLRAAFCIRSLYEEKASSDSRLLNPPIIPDALTIVGRSKNWSAPGRREHVVPRRVITMECHEMIKAGRSDEEIAAFIAAHLKIVLVSPQESAHLDAKAGADVRQKMPLDWKLGGDPYRRLGDAGIVWDPIS